MIMIRETFDLHNLIIMTRETFELHNLIEVDARSLGVVFPI